MSLYENRLQLLKFTTFKVPEDYLKKVVANYHTSYGAVCADDGKLLISHHADAPTFEALQLWNEEQEDVTLLMTFSNSEKPLNDADLQPFITLRDAKDNPMVACCLSGDFSTAEDSGSERTNAALSMDDLIQPQLAEVWDKVSGDIDKLFEHMRNEGFRKRLFGGTKNGFLTLFGANGKVAHIMKGDYEHNKLTGQKWGWSSYDLGKIQTVKPAEPPKAEEPPAPPAKKKRTLDREPTPPTIVPPTQPEQPRDVKVPPKEETSVLEQGFTITDGKLFYQSPDAPGHISKDQIRSDYEKNCGYKPENFLGRPICEVKDPKIIKKFASLANLKAVQTAKKQGEYPEQQPVSGNLITADEKRKIPELIVADDAMLKGIDNKEEMSVDELKALESELPTFAEATGDMVKDIWDTKRFSPAFLAKLQAETPRAFMQLLLDWRFAALMQRQRVKALENRNTELEEQLLDKKSTQSTTQQEPAKKKRTLG